ncbi:MAG: sulfotransferase family 2 domain-containing protein [Bacteroidota bacterium]
MVISDQHKYIFIAVPKTGTTSISSFLLKNDPTAVKNLIRVGIKNYKVQEHITALELRKMLGNKFDEYTSFGFVRYPYSKILSSYFFYSEGRAAKKVHAGKQTFYIKLKVLFAKMLPFSLWALLYPYNSCRGFLVDKDGKLLVNYIGYFENLEKDFSNIVGRLGFDSGLERLSHLNWTSHDEFDSYMRNGILKRILARKVRSDLTLFYRLGVTAEVKPGSF